jgi:hypothetical protein
MAVGGKADRFGAVELTVEAAPRAFHGAIPLGPSAGSVFGESNNSGFPARLCR